MAAFGALIGKVAAGIGAKLAEASLGSILLRVGGSLVLSSLSRRMAARAARGASQGWGTRGATQKDTLAPHEIVYGQVRKGGVIIFDHTSDVPGAPSSHLDLVIVFAACRVADIGAIYFDGELAVPAGSNGATGRWAGQVEVQRALGQPGQVAFSRLRELLPEYWTVAHRMEGCAGIWIRMYYDPNRGPDIFPTGQPNITADITGKNDILDPRTGLRGWTDNAMLCTADYMSLDTVRSIGAAIGAVDGIDADDLIEAANVCDELVAVPGGGWEKRYTCNGVISLADDPQTIIDTMKLAAAGECVSVGGRFSLRAGAYRVPVHTFTIDEAVEEPILTTRVDMAEQFNAVRGRFFSPLTGGLADDYPPVIDAAYVAEDRGRQRWTNIDLPLTNSASMAQRIALIQLRKARLQQTVEWPGQVSCLRAAGDDTVALTVPAPWGFTAKPFEVHGVSLGFEEGEGDEPPRLIPRFVLRETSPLVYDWNASAAQVYAAAPRTNLPSPFSLLPPGVPLVTEQLYDTRDNAVKALMRITWSASGTGTVDRYEVRIRRPGGAWEFLPATRNLTIDRLDIEPGAYDVQVRAVSTLGVRSDWEAASTQAQILGLGAPPVSLGPVSILSLGGQAMLRWALSPDLDVRVGGQVMMRHSSAAAPMWSNGISLGEVPGASTMAVVPLMPGTYMIRARDSVGVLGPVTMVTTDGIQAVPFAPVGTLQEDDDFTGVHSGTVKTGVALQIAPVGGNVPAQAIYTFAAGFDFGVAKGVRLRREVLMTPVYLTADLYAVPDLWALPDLYQSAPDGADVRVEIRTTPDNPGGSPVWSAWRRLEADEVFARGVQARAVLTSTDPKITPSITRLRIAAHEVT